jgi:hypothetical protein
VGIMNIKTLTLPFIFSFLLLVISTSAQSNPSPVENYIINPQGWKIPKVSGRPFDKRVPWKNVGENNSKTIYFTSLTPDEWIILQDTAYYETDKKGKKKIQSSPMRAALVKIYDVDGKPFCYRFSGPRVSITKSEEGIITTPVCCTTGFTFYDEDGDGKFEKMVYTHPSVTFKLDIPEWVLTNRVN